MAMLMSLADHVLRHAIHGHSMYGTPQAKKTTQRGGCENACLRCGAEPEHDDWISGLDQTNSWQLQALPADVSGGQEGP